MVRLFQACHTKRSIRKGKAVARYVIEYELLENVWYAFGRLDRKYGKDWTEWQDVRDAINKLIESNMERTQYYTVKAVSEDEALQKFVQYQEDYDPEVGDVDAEEKIHYEQMLAKVREGYGYGDGVGICKDRHGCCSVTIIED